MAYVIGVLFLFACYTGTAYADTVSITEENLFRDEKGSLWLKYHRKKNKMLARVNPIHTHPDPYRSRYPSPDILAGNRH